jgi:hypothetical protein
MPAVRIGQARIADAVGTHEPGEVVDYPTAALLELALSKAVDPDSKLPYCEIVSTTAPAAPAAPTKPTAVPDTEPAASEKTP